jgi:hypothetical protein
MRCNRNEDNLRFPLALAVKVRACDPYLNETSRPALEAENPPRLSRITWYARPARTAAWMGRRDSV